MDSMGAQYGVFVKTSADGIITDINSSVFLLNSTDWIQIDSGVGDRYHHAQGNYLPKGIVDDDGIYNYKLVDGSAVERTDTEKEPEKTAIVNATEIAELKRNLAGTDYISAKIAEGAATIEEYATEIAQRATWRARINELQSL